MHVSQIWQYPVKSMIGSTVAQASLGDTGVVGDRTWAVRDEVRGGIRGAKKIGALMQLAARYDDAGGVVITLPDGTEVSSADADAAARVSAAVDHPVTLAPLAPAGDLDHYRRGAADSDDIIEELRSIFGREGDEPLPDLSIFPPEIVEFESPPGTYVDAFPLMIMTTSALRSLSQALPDSAIDVRRFRPSFVIDTGDEPGHPELGWAGRTLRIGSTAVHIGAPCPRCVMVTREVTPQLPTDRAILRHIVRDLDQNVGAYATVVEPGSIAVGDGVRFA
ncbi:MAG: MOSC domain-containing protein [Actinobacteria bacterium]|nr:MOSC domain-containing protein [Actinomycetota bacterium]